MTDCCLESMFLIFNYNRNAFPVAMIFNWNFLFAMDEETKNRFEDAIFAFSMGEDVEAEKILKTLVMESHNSIEIFRALAEISLSLKNLNQAEDACRKALAINPDDLTSVVSLARILVQKGDKEGAEDASAKARLLGWKEELAEDESSL